MPSNYGAGEDSWTARRSNQSIWRQIHSENLLERQMLMLKLQYFGHLMWTANSLEKSLMLAKTEGIMKRVHQKRRWLDGITDAMDMNLGSFRRWWGTGKPGTLQSMGLQRVRHNWATEQQQQQQKWDQMSKDYWEQAFIKEVCAAFT